MLATVELFSTLHIAATAAIAGAVVLLAALLFSHRDKRARSEGLVIAGLTAAAVFLWRKSANVTALNHDGIPGFSANDWLAPTLTFVFLSVYRELRSTPQRRFARARGAATIIALAVNVITI